MLEFMASILAAIVFLAATGIVLDRKGRPKGKMKVVGYSKGEVVFMKTYENESITVSPGGNKTFDRMEIIEVVEEPCHKSSLESL